MKIKPNTAKLVDMQTRLDREAVHTPIGPVQWATVRLNYALAGLSPSLTIRVPIALDKPQSETERANQALRNARLVIDHACHQYGIASEEAGAAPVGKGSLPEVLEGLTQELGITEPHTRSNKSKR